ncbi:MAG: RlmE family RNA methyltransferase [Phycisphaeraceae bacterium]|nr:MAG: RlmE family RNA methyltransferase [Phycisphaeraceae bacterium]
MPQPRKLHDRYFKQAKTEGYLARSAFKLKEIQERFGVLRPGDAVLDLGCAPGSWLQVASEEVGPTGVVVGIDLQEVRPGFPENVHAAVGDAFTADPAALLIAAGRGAFDVVLSDMAPNTTGHGDDFLSVRLCRRVLEVCGRVLRRGGWCVMKVLEGAEYTDLLADTRRVFAAAKGFKPKSSREVSREMFIVAKGYRGDPGAGPGGPR